MFDLAIFTNPAQARRDFLATTEVAPQDIPAELHEEFDNLREASPDILMGGNFWWDFIRTYRVHLGKLVAGRAVMTVLVLAAVLLSEQLLNDANSVTVAIGFLAIYAVTQFASRIINAWTALLQSQLLVCTRTFVTLRMNVKLLGMGQIASDEFSTGNLKTLISSDIYRIAELFLSVTRNGIPCLLGVVILGPVIVWYMGIPGLIAMGAAFGALPLAMLLGRYVHRKEALIKQEEDQLATIIGEWVTNVRLLRFLGWETLMRFKVARHIRRLVIESTWAHGMNLLNFGISVTWWLVPIIALIWSNQIWGKSDDLVTLFASIWMLNHITLFIRWLPGIFIDYAAASACVTRLNRLFRHREISDDLMPATAADVTTAEPVRLRLEDVTVRFEGETRAALDDVTMTLDLTERTSVIGKVGAGKSTLLKLICAELKPTSGRVMVEFDNGVTADLWHENVYHRVRACVGYMPQEAYLSNATLAINVALATGHPQENVVEAIRMAELAADVAAFEAGLEEEVGETGVNLSGGQKQRVNLARALYAGRPVLVLDDPLSAVDTETEGLLMTTLIDKSRGFVLSSHRLAELRQTDRLLVIDAGRVIEDGTPAQLMNDPGSEFSQHLSAGDYEEIPHGT